MQAEVRFEARTAHALSRVVHPPVAAAHSDANTVDLEHEVRKPGLIGHRRIRRRPFCLGVHRVGPTICSFSYVGVMDVHRIVARTQGRIWNCLDAPQTPCMVEEREFVGHLANAKGSLALIGENAAVRQQLKLQVVELG